LITPGSCTIAVCQELAGRAKEKRPDRVKSKFTTGGAAHIVATASKSSRAEGQTNAAEFSVSELAGAIKRTIEDGFGYVRLRGEISGFRGPHSSGHCYFSLKDERAKIDAVVWRGVYGKLKIKPEEGMEVIAQGRVTTYPNSSKYQIVIEALEPAGMGALMALLEERKRKFAAEGLFADERKRPIPFLPKVVGIVTSPTGAVIRDMLHGFNERFPAHVIVWPVRVQGETSAGEVAAAVRGFNGLNPDGPVSRPDVLIVARGGGSLEDLWGFNEEIVVRAVAESAIPVISAVGHETDWTLVDLVADARAPTPTKAAEWAVPKYSDLAQQLDDLGSRLRHGARRQLETRRHQLVAAARGLPRLEDLVAMPRQQFDALDRRLAPALMANTQAHAMRLARGGSRLGPGLVAQRVERAKDRLERVKGQILYGFSRSLTGRRSRLQRVEAGLRPERVTSRVVQSRERLGVSARQLQRGSMEAVKVARSRLDASGRLLASLSYQSALKRGYAIVRTQEGRMVRSVEDARVGETVSIEFHDGQRQAQVMGQSGTARDADLGRTAGPSKTRTKPQPKPTDRDKQGSLF
jgi:exodeoxyribonuclease VII large subunit